ncbi:hypothetical protein AB0P17_29340 [Streptomyces sp. NPDC088124]|uniref:hypothetical protein n=1 Tax=Streptomyces sp. NPDC088124 TaxID=3154654 RepID=UPI0034190A83
MPVILIVFAAVLATMGLAFLLPDLIGRKPQAKNHSGKTEQRVRPAVGSYVLLAEPSGYLEYGFGAAPGSIGIIVRHSQGGVDDTTVFVHWLTKPDDLVHQDLAALKAARIYGVRYELHELAFFEPTLAVRTKH